MDISQIDPWAVERTIDPLTDLVTKRMTARAYRSPPNMDGGLVVESDGNRVEVMFVLNWEYGPLGFETPLSATFRIDQRRPETIYGSPSTDRKAFLFHDGDARKLLRDLRGLMGDVNFTFMIITDYKGTLAYQTQVGGFAQAFSRIAGRSFY